MAKSVLCIGGRGRLDEAAALLLMHLLEESGITARLASATEVSAPNVGKLEITNETIVCLCYLDPGNLARARYLMRRIRHHIPEAKIIAAFWGFGKETNEAAQAMGCEIVTELKDAVEKIRAAALGDPLHGSPVQHQSGEGKERPDAATDNRKPASLAEKLVSIAE
jgi:hypothetical protein